jgi:hypothetical protein
MLKQFFVVVSVWETLSTLEDVKLVENDVLIFLLVYHSQRQIYSLGMRL